jgi:hypothetical protein
MALGNRNTDSNHADLHGRRHREDLDRAPIRAFLNNNQGTPHMIDTSRRFCKNCGVDTDRDKEGKCKPCVLRRKAEYRAAHRKELCEKQKDYVARHRTEVLAKKRAYQQANRDQINAKKKQERIENPEKLRAQRRASYYRNLASARAQRDEYYKNNKVKVLLHQKEYYRRNIKRIREIGAEWVANNPEKVKRIKRAWYLRNKAAARVRRNNRRAKIRALGGAVSKDLVQRLFKLQRGKCACCRRPLGKNYHMDHIEPIARGGDNSDNNIQLLRAKCNLQKGAKHPVDFMQQRGFLL